MLRIYRQQVFRALIILLMGMVGAAGVNAETHCVIVFDKMQVRATIGTMPTSAAYLSITSPGPDGDRLLNVVSDLAGKTELHTMIMDNGIMRMRQIEGGIEIPAGKTVYLAPGGTHIMLMGLTAPLQAGTSYSLSLIFAKAGTVPVSFMALRPTDLSIKAPHSGH